MEFLQEFLLLDMGDLLMYNLALVHHEVLFQPQN